jgi:hypothetical protein
LQEKTADDIEVDENVALLLTSGSFFYIKNLTGRQQENLHDGKCEHI